MAKRIYDPQDERGLVKRDLSILDNIYSVLDTDIGTVTSRDDIINPYELVNINDFKRNARGQALYQHYLAMAQEYANRQQASYDEWYNSEQQQVARQDDAGLNPDLLGIEPATAPETESVGAVPGANLPTSGQIAFDAVGSVASLVATVGSLAALPSSIGANVAAAGVAKKQAGLIGAQQVGQELANLDAFEGKVYGALSANLADATASAVKSGQKFDFSSWLNNPESHAGVFESYAPSGVTVDDPRYGSAFNRAIRNIEKIKGPAFAINSSAASGQTEFARALADPYFDNDLLTQIAYLEPVSQAMAKIDILSRQFEIAKLNLQQTYVQGLDGELASQDFNTRLKASIAKAGFDTDYYDGFDGDEVAALDLALKKSDSIIRGTEAMIKAHFREIWHDTSKPFAARAGAMYQLMGGTPSNWKTWLVSYAAANGIQSVSSDRNTSQTDFFGDSAADILETTGNAIDNLY